MKTLWEIVCASLLSCMFVVPANAEPAATKPLSLRAGKEALEFDADGSLLRWKVSGVPIAQAVSAGSLRLGNETIVLAKPALVTTTRSEVVFRFRWPDESGLAVELRHRLAQKKGASVWLREVRITSKSKLTSDLSVSLPAWSQPLPANTWLPLVNGVGGALGTNLAAAYRFAGSLPGDGTRLAIPLVSFPVAGDASRITIATDVFFSSLFTSNAVEWTYPARVGLENNPEQRTVAVIRHDGWPDAALTHFFDTVLRDVRPGPVWLHDIAMVDYDYLSDGGQGWFRDIDALAVALPKRVRCRKVRQRGQAACSKG